VGLEVFDPPEVRPGNAVRFTAREVHWRNLREAGSLLILPKHAFQTAEFNKINFEFPVVSGPYRLGEIKEGVFVKMKRRNDWWGRALERNRNVLNFETLTFRYFAERENAFEVFKKGLIDFYAVYTSRLWVNETRGEKFSKNWIVKQKVRNRKPVGFQGFAMNARRPPFDDLRVRRAMAHLLDRERMNRTIMYSQYFMHRSYYEDLYSSERPCTNEVYLFSVERARALLDEAGWSADPDTGRLTKDGRRFSFSFLTRDPSSDKFLAIYNEALKDVGIEMRIDRKDWAAWSKDMDEFNYDMTWAAWGAGLFKDPEPMWASKEADRRGGHNITGFKNARVDALIEEQKTIFDVNRRHEICRQIDAIVTSRCPYVLLWNIDYVRLLYWNKFGAPRTVLSKYGDESGAYAYWWRDEDSAADLRDAVESGDFLPPRDPAVSFDEAFKP
jgi:microcin C transport system substrate-binding protein